MSEKFPSGTKTMKQTNDNLKKSSISFWILTPADKIHILFIVQTLIDTAKCIFSKLFNVF